MTVWGAALQTIEALGTEVQRTTLQEYDAADEVRSLTTGLSPNAALAHAVTTTYAYDVLGRTVGITEAAGSSVQRRTEKIYDAADRLLSTRTGLADDPSNNRPLRTLTAYDALGRAVATTEAVGEPDQRRSTVAYDLGDRVQAVTTGLAADPNYAHPSTTTFAYDDLNREKGRTEAAGQTESRSTTTEYDADDNVTVRTVGLSNTPNYGHPVQTRTEYDAYHHPTLVIEAYGDPEERRRTFSYNAAGNLEMSLTGVAGNADPDYAHPAKTNSTFDALGRQVSQIEAASTSVERTTTYAYDAADNRIAQTAGLAPDPLYQNVSVTGTIYDELNCAKATIDPLQHRVTTVYDAANNVIRTTDARNHTTTFIYDSLNRLTVTIDPRSKREERYYDANDDLILKLDYDDHLYNIQYNSFHQPHILTDPESKVTTILYDAAGNQRAVTNPLTQTTTTRFDALNRPLASTDPNQSVTTTLYDALDNLQTTINPSGLRTTQIWDAFHRRTILIDPANGTTLTLYDAANNLRLVRDAANRTSLYTSDELNRPVTTTDPRQHPLLNTVTTTVYDAANNVTTLIDPDGNRTTYVYNAANQRTATIDPLGQTSSSTYYANGLLDTTTDRLGRMRVRTYDEKDRLQDEFWYAADGSWVDTLSYTYDDNGNLLTASNQAGTASFHYDADNQVDQMTAAAGLTMTIHRDDAGRVDRVADNRGAVTSSGYDASGRLTKREYQDPSGTVASFRLTYRPDGRPDYLRHYRTATVDESALVFITGYQYDPGTGQLSSVSHQRPGGAQAAFDNFIAHYDVDGRIDSERFNRDAVPSEVTTYGYDSVGQLTSLSRSLQYWSWEYDGAGNRKVARVGGGTTTVMDIGAGNRLRNDGTWTYDYDAEGNLKSKQRNGGTERWQYDYDLANQLIHVEQRFDANGPASWSADYEYDALGNRVKEVITQPEQAPQVTRFAYDLEGNVSADLNADGTVRERRLFLPGQDRPVVRLHRQARWRGMRSTSVAVCVRWWTTPPR